MSFKVFGIAGNIKMLFDLFWSFFKVGLFTFGGGYAMIPLLQAELVERKKWLEEKEIMDYYSIGQCTPGIIAVNVSTFTGYKLAGIKGAIFATLGIITPSIIIILSIANAINIFVDNAYVEHAFNGIRIVVIALIFDVIIKMWQKNIKTKIQMLIFIISLLVALWFSASPVWVVIGAAFVGLLLTRK